MVDVGMSRGMVRNVEGWLSASVVELEPLDLRKSHRFAWASETPMPRPSVVEVTRLRREQKRRVVLYTITHGQCHLEPELVTALKQQAFLYGVVVLPSSDHLPEFVPLLDRSQIVSGEVLTNRAERQRRALDIVGDATRAAPRTMTPVAAVPHDPHRRAPKAGDDAAASARLPRGK